MVKKIKLDQNSSHVPLADLLNKSELLEQDFEAKFGQPVDEYVKQIVQNVRHNGDEAILSLAEKFDGFRPAQIEVPATALKAAYDGLNSETKSVLEAAAAQIEAYQTRLMPEDLALGGDGGALTGARFTAVDSAGIYVPGGRFPLSSSVLMNVIPARVAGVKRVVMCTPTDKSGVIAPEILAAAHIAKVDHLYGVGGAQSIAAMAYGTDTIAPVELIAGPGSIFVTYAKKQVFGKVNIDMLAGPSEVLIIADESANACHLAADMLAQSEHDPMASSILVTTCASQLDEVEAELAKLLDGAPTAETATASLANYSALVHVPSLDKAVEVSNLIAPEHLELQVADAPALLSSLTNAGAIFVGKYSPEALGDYYAGPCHTLPTGGSASGFSVLSCRTFLKQTSIIQYGEEAFAKAAPSVMALADLERLHFHKMSVKVRVED